MNNKKTRVVTAGVLVHALGAFRRLMKSIVDALHLKSEISNFKFKFFAWVRASSAHLAQNSLYMRARVWAWALAFSMAALAAAPAGAQLGSTGTSSGLTLDDRAGGYWDWLIYPNAGILRISTNNAVSDLLTILNNGNVGIGTNNPTLAKLHIAGDMRATGNVMGAYLVLDNVGAPGSGGLIGRSGTGETLYWHDGTAARTVLHTGNLGSIAILNQNDLQAGSTFYVSSASVGGQTLLARTSGNVGIGVSGTPAEKLEVNGYVRVPAASGGLKMDALSVLYQSGGTLLINNSASQAIQITQAGSPKLAIDTNGNVGIGTAAPDTNVHVYESNTDTLPALKVEQASTGDSAVLISGDSRSWAIGIDASAGDGILKISSGTTLDNAVLGTRDVLTILGSGNAGIGTASPAFKFHVYDSNPTLLVEATASSSTIRMYKSGNSMGIINYDHFNLANLYIDNYYPGDATYGGIRFRRNTGTFGSPVLTEIMTLEGTGNVGIGTASPAQMLHVQGDINVATGQGFRINNTATSGQYLRGNGTRFVSSAIQASDLGTAAILNQSAIQSGAVFHVSSGSVDGQALLAAVSGRVGIGTNSPSGWGKLSVIESTTDSTLFLQNSNMSNDPRIAMDPTSGSPWVLGINNDDGDKFMIGNAGDLTLNSSIRMTIDTNGNVGIGTVTPIVTLHVEGGNLVVASGVTQTTITSAGNIQMPGSIIMDGNNGDVLDLDELEFQNAGADPNAYRLRRNATDLKWHDGTAARTLIHTGNIGTYETDPQVGAITTSYVPRWDGSALVTGTIYDNATSIGIGTGVPQEKLHIHDAGVNSKTKFTNSTTGAGATDGSAVGAVNLDTYLMNYEAGKLQLGTSNAWRMTILSGGNVGIGTENPVGRLDVYDANGYYQQGFRVLASSDTKAFVGVQAGTSTATGTYLTFMGYRAGTSNTTGLSNTFIGGLSGYNHKNGQGNTYLGVEAGYGDVSGNHNTFVGFESGYINTASRNTFVGAYSGDSNTAGQENVFLGYQAGQTNSSASQGTFVGYMAGSTNNGADNTFVGHLSGATNGSGTQNVFLGRRAGYSNSTGGSNVFVGYSAGDANTATGNVMVGWAAGDQNNSGNENVFVGYSAAGANTTGNGNTIVGYLAGNSQQTADGNTFVGRGAGLNTTTGQNTFLGYQSGVLNTGGGSNTFIGYEAGRNNTTGNYNTTLGRDAGYSLTMGTGNVLIGYQAGYNLTTSSNTLYIANKNYGSPLIYGDFHTGKVGIGTASPAARLQVDHVSAQRMRLK
ncbi:MAG: hypothetical protein HYT79_10375 [Elusimicrobia bacterium]|nr:hypothetical protein [Elusimicrobiota bacterium]